MNIKLFSNWEYWSSYLFYVPLLPYSFYLALKYRSFGFFSAVNPSIEGSGNGLESKYDTVQLLPQKYRPTTILVNPFTPVQSIKQDLLENDISYPLIIKPDIGYRGLLVKKINTEYELVSYIKKYQSIALLIQEFISYPNECGIFYHRLPNKTKGHITSITLKKYLSIRGNGIDTLQHLIREDDRAIKYESIIHENIGLDLSTVPKKGAIVVLSIIGNHSKGTQFISGNHLINEALENTLDKLNKQIDGWFYGRIDVKYESFELLVQGENFKIIELNGILSEPTHIYDASKGTYLMALKSIKDHWKITGRIGQLNYLLKKGNYTNFSYLINLYFRHKTYQRKIKKLTR